jgi:hypothetical protein
MTPERWGELKNAGADEFLLKRVDSAALERDLLRVAQQHAKDGAQRQDEEESHLG